MNCIFCDPANFQKYLVSETTDVWIILNKHPASPQHCVVIPKKHVESMTALTSREITSIFSTVRWLQRILKTGANGITVFYLEGSPVGQSEPHWHIHLVPSDTPLFQRSKEGLKEASPEDVKRLRRKLEEEETFGLI